MRVTESNIHQVIASLSAKEKLATDCETSGLDWDDRLFSIQIADDSHAYIFRGPEIKQLGPLFSQKRYWIFKNAKFDMRMLHWEGYHPHGLIEDVGVKARIVKNDLYGEKSYSLDALSKRYLGQGKEDELKEYIKKHNCYETRYTKLGESYKVPRFMDVPDDIFNRYAAKDARLTYDLSIRLDQLMDEEDRKVHGMECALIPVIFDMEMRGTRIDLDYTHKAMAEEQKAMQFAKEEFYLHTGKPYTNSKAILIPLFEAAGEKIHYTAKGNPCLTDEVLETYKSPVAKVLQKYKYHEKRVSTFYSNFIDMADDNGYVHPSLWQEGTRTRRFSCSKPNLQQLPKKEEGTEIRKCIVADPGHVLVSMDFSQMEYKLMASYAEETRVIEALKRGEDFHQAIADQVGIDRDKAKTLNFAILYGAGDAQIASMLGCSVAEARKLRTKYYLALPRVEKFKADVERVVKQRGYVKNWFGFKCREADPKFSFAIPNHLIQSGCAEVTKIAMIKCYDYLKKYNYRSRMIASIHDQIVFSLHKDEYTWLAPQLNCIMDEVFPETNGIKLHVDVEWSENSLAKSELKKGYPP